MNLHRRNSEKYWHDLLELNPFILPEKNLILISKPNIGIPYLKIPDFLAVNLDDGTLDILEIKRPDTPLVVLNKDGPSWSTGANKFIGKMMDYKCDLQKIGPVICEKINREYRKLGLVVQLFDPKCYILAGNKNNFTIEERHGYKQMINTLNPQIISIWNYDNLLP